MSQTQAPSLGTDSDPTIPDITVARGLRGETGHASGVLSALTIDVEDYFQVSGFENVVPRESWPLFESRVEDNTDRLLALLAEAKVTATFFVLGWTAERYPRLVRRIQSAGHELACHSYAHRIVYQCTPEEFRADTRRAKHLLEDVSGTAVVGYRAPSFSITRESLWALTVLAEEGFQYDSSIFPVWRDRYGIPSAPRHPFRMRLADPAHAREPYTIMEAPLSTVKFFGTNFPLGGGGYLRLYPGWLFLRALSRVVEGERRPAILYLHPWECDPDQPRIRSGSCLSRLRHYVNLDKTEKKLKEIIALLPLAPLRKALSQLNDLPFESLETLAGN